MLKKNNHKTNVCIPENSAPNTGHPQLSCYVVIEDKVSFVVPIDVEFAGDY